MATCSTQALLLLVNDHDVKRLLDPDSALSRVSQHVWDVLNFLQTDLYRSETIGTQYFRVSRLAELEEERANLGVDFREPWEETNPNSDVIDLTDE